MTFDISSLFIFFPSSIITSFKLNAGENIAIVTDAGTPGISDPGEIIVKQAIENIDESENYLEAVRKYHNK